MMTDFQGRVVVVTGGTGAPGCAVVNTPANRTAMPKAKHEQWPKVDEIAATILFLASPESRVTRGAIVPGYGKS